MTLLSRLFNRPAQANGVPKPLLDATTKVIVMGWPDKRIDGRMWNWLIKRFPEENIVCTCDWHVIRARNLAVREQVLKAPRSIEWFLFLDNDVVPNGDTACFLELGTDLAACTLPQANAKAFHRPDSFHCGLFRARREVFEKMPPPWFMHEFTPDGTDLTDCECGYFRKKAEALGFTVSHGGSAEHGMTRTWGG